MNKVGKINFREIKRISPSQFYSMKNCAYKSLLAEAFEKKPLLPVSPNAYFGTVLHKMLELIAKGLIKNEEDFNRVFEEQVKVVEGDLQKNGYSLLIPLQKNVKDFGLKKILLKKHLRAVSEQPTKASNANFKSEKWFESKDKLIAGKIDLVVESENDIEIIDFKTGAITEDILDDSGEIFSEIKKEYQEQLKIYASLFFDSTGKFPAKLGLLDLAKQKFTIEFTESECKGLFEEAKRLLKEVNNSIIDGVFNAKPNNENCKYCLYRPACSYYLNYLRTNDPINDVCGLIKDVFQYRNGNVTVVVKQSNNVISVTGFELRHFEYFKQNINKHINIFNLKKESVELVYSATRTTKIYEP